MHSPVWNDGAQKRKPKMFKKQPAIPVNISLKAFYRILLTPLIGVQMGYSTASDVRI
jgi:hypothetical protein